MESNPLDPEGRKRAAESDWHAVLGEIFSHEGMFTEAEAIALALRLIADEAEIGVHVRDEINSENTEKYGPKIMLHEKNRLAESQPKLMQIISDLQHGVYVSAREFVDKLAVKYHMSGFVKNSLNAGSSRTRSERLLALASAIPDGGERVTLPMPAWQRKFKAG